MEAVHATIRFAMATGRLGLQADLTQTSHEEEHHEPTTTKPTNANHLVPLTAGTASAAEDRTLNTWRIAFKPAH